LAHLSDVANYYAPTHKEEWEQPALVFVSCSEVMKLTMQISRPQMGYTVLSLCL